MKQLEEISDGPLIRSSLYETEPIDCPPGSPPFINVVVGLKPKTNETPESLLTKLQEIEKEFGRKPKTVPNEPRPLDLDIISFRGEARRSAQLTIPHPRAHTRRFVLEPLSELAPDYVLQGQTESVAALARGLPNSEKVRRLA